MINLLKKFINKRDNENMKIYIFQMQILKLANSRLREIYEQCIEFPVSKDLIKTIKTSDNIFKELSENKNKITKMNLFIEYYIQEVIKILENYVKIKNLKDNESIKTCEAIEKFMKCIVIAFNNIYKDLISYDKTDMEIDIGIMINELKNNFNGENK